MTGYSVPDTGVWRVLLKITILTENTATVPGLEREHGISMLVESPGGAVLWDTGQSGLFLRNAVRMGVSPADIRHVVLSHGHYDHAGGLADILALVPDAAVYIHPEVFRERYSCSSGGSRYIGFPCDLIPGVRDHRVLRESRAPQPVIPGVTVTGEIPRETGFESAGEGLFLDAGCTASDPVSDDRALVIETRKGLGVLLGCAHAGIVNTLRYVSQRWNTGEFALVAGGMHLSGATGTRIEKTVAALREFRIAILAPGHCTGEEATAALARAFPEEVRPLSVGWTWAD